MRCRPALRLFANCLPSSRRPGHPGKRGVGKQSSAGSTASGCKTVKTFLEAGGRGYFSTDPGLSAQEVLELAADRGALEETFKVTAR
jgi:hypothetical protein